MYLYHRTMKSLLLFVPFFVTNLIIPITGEEYVKVESSSIVFEKEPLVFPPVLESSNGILDISISIKYGNWSIVQHKKEQENIIDHNETMEVDNNEDVIFTLENTRLLDGILPGKTLIVSPGDTLRILFTNELEYQETAVNSGLNQLGYPDHVNLHFHGGHVSGELPSDDIRMKIAPQESFQYETVFPKNHMGGTHWIHPHVHGSSALQVGGGAAAALIVRENDEYYQLPDIVKNATDVLLFVQDVNPTELERIRVATGDKKLSIRTKDLAFVNDNTVQNETELPDRFRIINGQYQPYYEIHAQEWYRFRIVYAGWLDDPLRLAIENMSTDDNDCEMMLLAKDGIYINDFPRKIISALPIPTGGRADVMIKCNQPGSVHNVIDFASQTVLELRVAEVSSKEEEEEGALSVLTGNEADTSSVLPSWSPQSYPEYLRDLRNTQPTKGCSCETRMRDCPTDIVLAGNYDREHKCINNKLFNPDEYIHSIPFGSVVERVLSGNRIHPYHQHVYPFQLTSPYGDEDNMVETDLTYFQAGDWHDVFSSRSGGGFQVIRFHTDVHFGRLMVHCHVLSHEDEGTMTQEYVGDPETTECNCSPYILPSTKKTNVNYMMIIIAIFCGIAIMIAFVIAIIFFVKRK